MNTKIYIVGRSPQADIRINGSTQISREHISLNFTDEPDVVRLVNLRPTNGTYIMQRSQWTKLQPDAHVIIPRAAKLRLGDYAIAINELLAQIPQAPLSGTIRFDKTDTPSTKPKGPYRNELGEIID